MSSISGIVKSIQNIMRKDAGTYGDAQRSVQIRLDELKHTLHGSPGQIAVVQ